MPRSVPRSVVAVPRFSARAAAVAALTLAGAASPASAGSFYPGSARAIEISSDGHYLLDSDGGLRDLATGETIPAPVAERPLDLALTRPLVLAQRGSELWLEDRSGPTVTAKRVSVAPGGAPVGAARGRLARDGRTVVFQTTEATPRIIAVDVATLTATVRLRGARLSDVSEDGRVITWSRQLPDLATPADAFHTSGYATKAYAVGYQVAGSAPRVVERTHTSEDTWERADHTCEQQRSYNGEDPLELAVSQDGAAPRYSLTLESDVRTSAFPGGLDRSWDRVTPTGRARLAYQSWTSKAPTEVTFDRVSGAYAVTSVDARAAVLNSAKLVADDGTSRALGYPYPDSSRTQQVPLAAVPFERGGAAAYTVSANVIPADPAFPTGTLLTDPAAVGASTTPWLTLPRSGDLVDDPAIKGDAIWLTSCSPQASDYVSIATSPAGSPSALVRVRSGAATKPSLTAASASISWFGIPVWSHGLALNGTTPLPGVPLGLPGFQATIRLTLADHTVLTQTAPLRRTR